ncbi:MAG: NAD(P)/FAD-dependent oxidoreductase [Eubacteriales bacterium]|nr:NAD(P)/FAD-dependent oxidoreductase [Eubacteriales bacterium]
MEKKRILIVGGGASGLMAAITAARRGAAVTVLEHNEKPGKKLCATGNGKCNLTNLEMPRDAYRGAHPEFVREALRQFSVQDTVRFFSELGIYVTNRNGYLYPHSNQASSVTEVLCMEARSLKVKIKTNEHVKAVFPEGGLWKVQTEGWTYEGDAVILANGSKASAISGSDGSGYELAKSLGHRVIKPLPALNALKCKGKSFAAWAGVRVEGKVTLCLEDIPLKSQQGELQLTEYGISGIPVFQLSRYAIRALDEGCRVSLLVNFLPEFDAGSLHSFLESRRRKCPYKNDQELLIGLFPDKLNKVLLKQPDLEAAIREFPLTVTGGMPFAQAQVCSGGVSTEEVRPDTMESRLHKGLYFAGELLDVDGTCGGYNLQWAWSSGAAAGSHAAGEET